MEVLQWLLIYYFSEVPSWPWYYPYHYAPFASDMKGLTQFKVRFQRGSPFNPFDHLMAVLPPSSTQLLPKAYRKLMTDEKSNLICFYPTELEIDTDGKHYKWQGVCKLPFIDEELLFKETRKLENELEKHEVQRNMENVNKIFVRRSNMSESQLSSLVANLTSGREQDIVNMENDLRTLAFEFHVGSQHISRPLPGVEFPEKSISKDDIKNTQLWHEIPVRKCRWRFQVQKSHNNMNYSKASASNGCAEDRYVSHFTKSSLDVTIHKDAGIGWAGRGVRTGIATHKLPIGASSVTPTRDIYLSSNKAKGLKWQRGDSVDNSFQPSRNDSIPNNWRQSKNIVPRKWKDLERLSRFNMRSLRFSFSCFNEVESKARYFQLINQKIEQMLIGIEFLYDMFLHI